MTAIMTAALNQLNAVYADTGRQYRILEECQYTLVMPSGGHYPACDAHDMVVRLVRLKIAAEGRDARLDGPVNIFRKGK